MRTLIALIVLGGIAAVMSSAAMADKYHGNVPEPLIGRWCNAWGEGDKERLYIRCKKSNFQRLVDAEGYVHTVKITQGSVIIDGQRCKGLDIYEHDVGPGRTLKLQCHDAKETWLVNLDDIKKNQITIERDEDE